MNVYDSQRMADVAMREGYQEAARIEDADLVVLNTCHIRERASEKIYSELGKVRELKEERDAAGLKTTIVVAGCVAQAEGAEIVRRQSAVDLVVGPQNYHRLPQLLREAEARPGVVDTAFPRRGQVRPFARRRRPPRSARAASAPSSRCRRVATNSARSASFPIPAAPRVSRPVAKVMEEIARLAEAGVREVTLIGQNVNAYHGQGERGRVSISPNSSSAVAEIPGILRIRYTTSHPNDMSEALILAHRDNPSLGALSAPADPVGLEPNSGGHEPGA